MERQPDSVIPKPCRLLCDPDGPVNFIAADPVLAVHDLPHSREPLVYADVGILHHRSRLQRELSGEMFLSAFPTLVLLQKENVAAAAALRAGNTVRPAARYHVVTAVDRIREV